MPSTTTLSPLRRGVSKAMHILCKVGLTATLLAVMFCGLQFYSQTVDSCQAEGDTFAWCIATLEYQTAKQIVQH